MYPISRLNAQQLKKCTDLGLEYQFKIGNDYKSTRYATQLSSAIAKNDANEKNRLFVELINMTKLPMITEVLEDTGGAWCFVIGLMADITELNHIVSIKRAHEITNINERVLRRMCENKEVIAKKIGREWAIDIRSLALNKRIDVNETTFFTEDNEE